MIHAEVFVSRPLRLLWIATKPPLPATDGGRLVTATTLRALADAGVAITVITPDLGHDRRSLQSSTQIRSSSSDGLVDVDTTYVDAQPRDWLTSTMRSLVSGRPISIERHAIVAMRDAVARRLARESFDIVHVEQLQALASAGTAATRALPCVMRAQNVESAIWSAAASHRPALAAPWFRREAARMRRFEADALDTVDLTITLSAADAAQLSALAPKARVIVVPPPVSASKADAALDGAPAFLWIGSPGWFLNDDARGWLLREVWPAVQARLPCARLHVFAREGKRDAKEASASSVVWHGAPDDSRDAFDPSAILLLPLRHAAGVRMRLLEAWARGVPAIATPAAVEGLDAIDGRDVLIASDARGFGDAAARLAEDRALRARLITGGRATLARHHDPAKVARALIDVYREAIDRRRHARSASSAAR